jgi:hypothetical protein
MMLITKRLALTVPSSPMYAQMVLLSVHLYVNSTLISVLQVLTLDVPQTFMNVSDNQTGVSCAVNSLNSAISHTLLDKN